MTVSLKGLNLVSLHDLSIEQMHQVLATAQELKRMHTRGQQVDLLGGKTLAMIFQKPSLRTRVSFESGMHRYGGHAIYLGPNDIQLGKRESTKDIARTLSRYADAIMARTFEHTIIEDLAKAAGIPVINGLTDRLHPCQILADLMTVQEKKGNLSSRKMAFLGDGNNVAHSLMYGCAKVGMDLTLAVPEGYDPDQDILAQAREDAEHTGASLQVTHDLGAALEGADVIYTDVWASMGQEAERAERIEAFTPYQVNSKLMASAPSGACFMHCLPAHRDLEVTSEIIDGENSIIFDEAENRLHAEKALLHWIFS